MRLSEALIVIGIILLFAGVVYFSQEYIEDISSWGKLTILILLSVLFASSGKYSETQGW